MTVESKPKAASEDPKSLQNGLGLDTLLSPEKPITKPAKPSPVPSKAAEKAPTDEKVEPKAEVKVAATKDAKEPKEDADDAADVGTLNKRLKDTRDYATKLGQENKELKKSHSALVKELEIVKAKLDGTYVEPAPVPPEQLTAMEKFKARVEIDNQLMVDQYGAEQIQKLIWDTDSPYQQLEIMDPAIKMRVSNSTRPVLEAMKVVEEHKFFEKYGRDPVKIREAIIAEERENLTAEIKAELKGKPISTVNSLSGANGAPRETNRVQPAHSAVPDLSKVFPSFHAPNTA